MTSDDKEKFSDNIIPLTRPFSCSASQNCPTRTAMHNMMASLESSRMPFEFDTVYFSCKIPVRLLDEIEAFNQALWLENKSYALCYLLRQGLIHERYRRHLIGSLSPSQSHSSE